MSLLQETRISLRDVARRFSRTYETVKNWTTIGCGGRVLEAVRIGGTWYTSEQALIRFSESAAPLPPTAAREKRRHKKVMERLDIEFGVKVPSRS